MKKNLFIIAAFVCLLSMTNAFATTYYVSPDGIDDDTGTSWSSAFETLGQALDTATSGDEIWVEADTYTPGTTRSSTFQMVAGVDVYGGFEGDETSLSQRDWEEHVTTLTGEIGTVDANDNCYHVVTGGVSGASLDGFTITKGYANGSAPADWGGGLFDTLDVYNCIFEDNYASSQGGGAWIDDDCEISNCTFRDNNAGAGGAVYLYGAIVTFKNNQFYDNSAYNGGAIYIDGSTPSIVNCTFSQNSTTSGNGGALYFYQCSPGIVVDNCVLWGNTAAGSGDQIFKHLQCSNPSYSYCDIEDSNGSGVNWDTSLGTDDGNNIDADPCFNDANSNNLHLTSVSPCIDAGDPNGSYTGQVDMDGQPRVINQIVDMGADEFAASYNVDADEYYSSIVAATNDANSGNEILVYPGTHYEYISVWNKSLQLHSIDPNDWDIVAKTIIDANGSSCGIHFEGGGEISGLTVRNASFYAIFAFMGNPKISNCIVRDNYHGIYVGQNDVTIVNNKIIDNRNGIYLYNSGAVINNNLICGSTNDGIYFNYPSSSPIISNNTVVENKYGIYLINGTNEPNISNCILWGNTTDDLYDCNATYSCIEDGDSGVGNISVDPNFSDDGYHITSASPCIGVGDPNGDYSGQVDIDNQQRVIGGAIDMGADEFASIYNVDANEYYSTIQDAIDDANDNDTITVYPGTYDENLSLPDKNIALQSTDPTDWDIVESTIVDGDRDSNTIKIEGDCTIKGFKVTGGATGISCSEFDSTITDVNIIVSNCLITDNNGAYWGGGIELEGSGINCLIDKCYIYSNHSTGSGGGLDFWATTDLTIKNTVFANNSSLEGGAVSFTGNAKSVFENCTFYGNQANYGGGIYGNTSTSDVNNCILWGNDANNYPQICGSIDVSYSIVEGGITTANCGATCDDVVGNIDADPCFVDANNNDFRIKLDSPGIDAGDPNFAAPNEEDIDGNDRVMGYSVDMGAYEMTHSSSYNSNSENSYSSIQSALNDANDGDVIIVFPGTYYESIDFNGVNCTLRSMRPNDWDMIEATIIDANGGPTTLVTFDTSEDANAVLNGFTITNNIGTGIYCSSASPTITNCLVNDNGRGIHCVSSSSPAISGCIISENGNGSGMYNSSSSPTIENCFFIDNTNNDYGGAMYNSSGAPNVTNCVFTGNSASSGGGAINNGGASLTAINCTFVDNSDGAMYNLNPSPMVTIVNCIFWDNPDGQIINAYNSDPSISYSDIEDCFDGLTWDTSIGTNDGNNIDIFPCLNDPNNNDFNLTLYSRCIDAGDNTVIDLPTDIAGDTRKVDDPGTFDTGNGEAPIVDMGAYEFSY